MSPQSAPHPPAYLSYRSRLPRIARLVATALADTGQPVVAEHQLFQILGAQWTPGKKLNLRKEQPDLHDLGRLIAALSRATVVVRDKDYPRRVWRIVENGERPAEEVCCLADPFCHVSHLSAMRRYGLTERIPRHLHLKAPSPGLLASLIAERTGGVPGPASAHQNEPSDLYRIHHPERVRGEALHVLHSSHLGMSTPLRGSFARLASIGQVFLDMLERPALSGGMAHVLDTWDRHAATYLDDIVEAVDQAPKDIHKVRAGYILQERLGLRDSRIAQWKSLAQRGGSRRLDPTGPYAPTFSEDWMISINA